MDIEAWLRGLGLEQYEPAFRDNFVDADVLPDLTAEDLIGLGVTAIGHRRKLLAAIAALGVEPTRDLTQRAASAAAPRTSSAPGEWRARPVSVSRAPRRTRRVLLRRRSPTGIAGFRLLRSPTPDIE